MAKKKITGDCKKSFKFSNGVKAPLVDRDDPNFEIDGWISGSKMPSTEKILMEKTPNPDKEHRVVFGYNNDGNMMYLLQEKI